MFGGTNQTITVIYQNENFMVDYNKLLNSSTRFNRLMQPYIANQTDPARLQLRILYDRFSPRNVRNFLKMLQNQKNDVHSNEIQEVCEIAKVFGSENIYNKALIFVNKNFDPNYVVPSIFSDENCDKYLLIEFVRNLVSPHAKSLNELQFNERFTLTQPVNESQQQKPPQPSVLNDLHSVCYKIQILNPFMKCSRYIFSQDGRILYTAKQRQNEIFIGQGNDVHIHENKLDNSAQISQNSEGYNIVNTDEQQFRINYVMFGSKKQYSMQTSFNHKGKMLEWTPKDPESITSYAGEYNHEPIPSKKNTILRNAAGNPTFVFRKMAKNTFEIECVNALNPLIVFAIGISQVVGPALF